MTILLWVIIFFILGLIILGLILGLVFAWQYKQKRAQESEAQILSTQTSHNQKEQRLQDLQTPLKEQEASKANLSGQLSQAEQSQPDLATRFEEQDPVMQPTGTITPSGPSVDISDPQPDDLKRIEGIGPKISSVLNAAGITTFSQLASTSQKQLELIISDVGISLADPSTWPEQATLAATGDWDGLANLQDRLKGGRRV